MKRKYKRTYLLNGKEIEPVLGIVHTARADKPFPCLDCEEQIFKGEKWVEFNSPFHSEFYWHLKCYAESHSDYNVGVKTIRKAPNSFGIYFPVKSTDPRYRYGRSFVICEPVSAILANTTPDQSPMSLITNNPRKEEL